MKKSSINIYGCNENKLWEIVFFSFAIIYLKCKLHVCIFGSYPYQRTKIGIGVENACMLLLFFFFFNRRHWWTLSLHYTRHWYASIWKRIIFGNWIDTVVLLLCTTNARCWWHCMCKKFVTAQNIGPYHIYLPICRVEGI